MPLEQLFEFARAWQSFPPCYLDYHSFQNIVFNRLPCSVNSLEISEYCGKPAEQGGLRLHVISRPFSAVRFVSPSSKN